MYAASRNEIEAVEFLLRNGATPSLQNNENQTAGEIAQSKGNLEAGAAIQNYVKVHNTPTEADQRGVPQAACP